MKKILILMMISLLVLAACQQGPQAPQGQQDMQDDNQQPSEEEGYRTSGDGEVTLQTVPQGPYVNGRTYEFSWIAEGGNSIRNSQVQSSTDRGFDQMTTSNPNNNGPGLYKGTITVDAEAGETLYIRGYAMIEGRHVYSDTVTRQVTSGSGSQADTSSDSGEEESMDDGQSGDVQVVEVTAFQFGFDPDPIRVEAGTPVRLEITSTDVGHGIAIPAFGVNKQAPAGETVSVEFTPDQTGEFRFFCNVYCGQGHSSMDGTLIVE